jgi:hypothetical protein
LKGSPALALGYDLSDLERAMEALARTREEEPDD